MKKYLPLSIFLMIIILSGCQNDQGKIVPTTDSRETVVEETSFHNDEIINTLDVSPPSQSEPKKEECYISCYGSVCFNEKRRSNNCWFSAYDKCYEYAECTKEHPGAWCEWEKSEGFEECKARVNEEIAEVNKRFDENFKHCSSSETCRMEFIFRDDHFEFEIPTSRDFGFGGEELITSYLDKDGSPLYSADMIVGIYYDKPSKYMAEDANLIEYQLEGAKVTEYIFEGGFEGAHQPNCAEFVVEYKDKFYRFRQHEGCLNFSGKFAESFKFYN